MTSDVSWEINNLSQKTLEVTVPKRRNFQIAEQPVKMTSEVESN
jgi:hypothetical protein